MKIEGALMAKGLVTTGVGAREVSGYLVSVPPVVFLSLFLTKIRISIAFIDLLPEMVHESLCFEDLLVEDLVVALHAEHQLSVVDTGVEGRKFAGNVSQTFLPVGLLHSGRPKRKPSFWHWV